MHLKKTAVVLILFTAMFYSTSYGQTNASQEINYKARTNGFHSYTTTYDNGYVILNDGTTLDGKISLIGTSYANVYGVRIRTNSGQKYSFFMRSLKEFGLSNSIVNDTPGAFNWYEVDRGVSKFVTGTSGGNKAVSEGRNGYSDYAYVKTKSGQTYEGRVDIKEVKQKIKKIDVKTADKQKYSFTADEISSFGVKKYVDKKFNTDYSLLRWKYGKSDRTPCFVNMNDGSKMSGKLVLIKDGEMVKQVQVFPMSGKGKAQKAKYVDIKNYGVNINIEHVYGLYKKDGYTEDLIHPEQKFYPGALRLEDGTIKEGLIAKAKPGQLSDVYFAQSEESEIAYIASSEIDDVNQILASGVMETYRKNVYDATHVQDYPKDLTSRWRYKTRNEGSSTTEYMWAYLELSTGEVKIGWLAVKTMGAIKTFLYKKNMNDKPTKYKSPNKYGLLASKEKDQYEEESVSSQAGTSSSSSNEIAAYNPMDESFLASKTTSENIQSNGYVITSSGEKIEGKVAVTAPPKLWFVTDVTLTTADGMVTNYVEDENLSKAVVIINGEEKEFVNFENAYVEVLHRDGDAIHFRNPHPTTNSTGGDLANLATGALMENADQAMRAYGGSVTKKSNPNENTDWTSEEVIKLYAKEFLILNEKTGKYAMYIPARKYNQIEGELMGSYEYLNLSKDQQGAYKKMSNPLMTMQFLNSRIYSK